MVHARDRALTDLLRGYHSGSVERDLLARLLGLDNSSRDEDLRRTALLTLAGQSGRSIRDDIDDTIRAADDVRRINVLAQLANRNVRIGDCNAEVHPKMNSEGRFLSDFNVPVRLELLLGISGDSLDHLLHFYDLVPDISRRLSLSPSFNTSQVLPINTLLSSMTDARSDRDRQAKLLCLLEFLGVDVADLVLDLKRDRYLSTTGLLSGSGSTSSPSSLLGNTTTLLNGTTSLLGNSGSLFSNLHGTTPSSFLLRKDNLNNTTSLLKDTSNRNILLQTSNLQPFLQLPLPRTTSTILNIGALSPLLSSHTPYSPTNHHAPQTLIGHATSNNHHNNVNSLSRSGTGSSSSTHSILNSTSNPLGRSKNNNNHQPPRSSTPPEKKKKYRTGLFLTQEELDARLEEGGFEKEQQKQQEFMRSLGIGSYFWKGDGKGSV